MSRNRPVARRPSLAARRLQFGAAVGAGIALFASLPPRGWWPLAFVGVALLALALGYAGPARRFALGATAGGTWFGLGLAWMARFTLPGYLVAVALETAVVALVVLAVPPRRGRLLAVPPALVAVASVRGRWPFGGLPLGGVAHGQVDGPLLSVASIGGPLAVVALVAAGGVALAALVEGRVVAALAAALLVIVGIAAGWLTRPDMADPGLRVAAVQGGGQRGIPGVVADEVAVFDRHIDAAGQVAPPVALVVLPEDVLDVDGSVDATAEARRVAALAEQFDATVVVGVVEGVGTDRFRNAAVAWAPDGAIADRVEKVHRVPFGEYVPARSVVSRFADLSLVPRDAVPGSGAAVLDTPAGRLGVSISYEVFFPSRSRTAVRNGAGLLLVPTNAASFTEPTVPSEEVAAARLRAVETGRWLIQAAPTGYSAIIDPAGRVVGRSELEQPAVLTADVARRHGLTPYARAGDLPLMVLATLLWIAAWTLHLRSNRGMS